ncbi:MAG TPA: HAD-IA family hydrolase [Candidatus Hydrogenedentes bacterium]|nr:HAD-IA family hydrolase [Candidatus Hydrogenedentota bacterium]
MEKYGLIFDMDGVLADTESLIAKASIDMFRELYKIELTAEDFRPFIGTGAVRYVEGPAEKLGITLDLERALEVRLKNFTAMLDAGECQAFPGAVELVEAAAGSGDWKLAIATSSPRPKAMPTLEAAGIPVEMFFEIITGDMVTHKKPHPEIYEAAHAALGLPKDSCVVIEDAVTGVTAAKAAGLKCIGITNSFRRDELAEADVVLGSLEDVNLSLLRRVIGD